MVKGEIQHGDVVTVKQGDQEYTAIVYQPLKKSPRVFVHNYYPIGFLIGGERTADVQLKYKAKTKRYEGWAGLPERSLIYVTAIIGEI